MGGEHPLKEIVRLQKQGMPRGICSICSANEIVIGATMDRAGKDGDIVLIEATANQVNQYGGYTGMKPADFRDFVHSIAKKAGYPEEKIILGGDHLGPLAWKGLGREKAMEEAGELIRQYVLAGFTKIHIDTSMPLGGDRWDAKPDTGIIAERAAFLCGIAEKAYGELKDSYADATEPVYVVGSEVPVPGGRQGEEEGIQVTRASDFEDTVYEFKKAFEKHGLSRAWNNVIAVVVQPGVEFGDESIHEYSREAARELTTVLKKYPDLVFEGHSTDYQNPEALKEMVEDGIAILKVGPALTFALREGLFALNMIEEELFTGDETVRLSRFMDVLDEEMVRNPENWEKHYHGSGNRLRLSRKYSYSDRCRYYLPAREVQEAIHRLLDNLGRAGIPMTLVSQYMPLQYVKIRKGRLSNDPVSLLKDMVICCLDGYALAAGGKGGTG